MSATLQKDYRLAAVALEVSGDHDGNLDAASEALVARILADENLVVEAVRIAARYELRHLRAQSRSIVAGLAVPPKIYTKEQQEQIMSGCRSFYDWRLMDGFPLGDATKTDVLVDSDRYLANAVGNWRSRRFLQLVAAEMDDDSRTVREVFGDGHLAELMTRAAKEAVKQIR